MLGVGWIIFISIVAVCIFASIVNKIITRNTHYLDPVSNNYLSSRDVGPNNFVCILFALKDKVEKETFLRFWNDNFMKHAVFRSIPILRRWRRSYTKEVPYEPDKHIKFIATPSTMETMRANANASITHEMSLDKPLWDIEVHQNYSDENGCLTGIFLRYHHGVADGVQIMKIMLSAVGYYEIVKNMNVQSPTPQEKPVVETRKGRIPWYSMLASWPVSFFKIAFVRNDPYPSPMKCVKDMDKLAPRSMHICELKNSVTSMKSLKPLGITVNDILTSALVGGFARIFRKELDGWKPPKPLHALMWSSRLSVREMMSEYKEGEVLGGNAALAPLIVETPYGEMSAWDRLQIFRKELMKHFMSAEIVVTNQLMNFLGVVPRIVADPLFTNFSRCASTSLSTMPGPVVPCFFAGSEIRQCFFGVPPVVSIHSFCTLLSYNDRVMVTVTTNNEMYSDERLKTFMKAVDQEISDILEAGIQECKKICS